MSSRLKRLERLEQARGYQLILQKRRERRLARRFRTNWLIMKTLGEAGMADHVEWIGPKLECEPPPLGKPASPMAIARLRRLIETGGTPHAR